MLWTKTEIILLYYTTITIFHFVSEVGAAGRLLWSADKPDLRRLEDVSFECEPIAGQEEYEEDSPEVNNPNPEDNSHQQWTCLLDPADADGVEGIDLQLEEDMEEYLNLHEEEADESKLKFDNVDIRENRIRTRRGRSRVQMERRKDGPRTGRGGRGGRGGGRTGGGRTGGGRRDGRGGGRRDGRGGRNGMMLRRRGMDRLVDGYYDYNYEEEDEVKDEMENSNRRLLLPLRRHHLHHQHDNNDERKLKYQIKTEGESSVLILRTKSPDSEVSISKEQISAATFGGIHDGVNYNVNLQSQMSECSFNKLRLVPYVGPGIVNGVLEVVISQNTKGVDKFTITNYITAAAKALLPNDWGEPDHVFYLIPPGSKGSWIGYGYYWYYRSMYNDKWGAYLSCQLHELGHNLNLRHSGQDTKKYGDQSGIMGFSYSQYNGPKFCYNAAKSSHLGWYEDRTTILDPLDGDVSWEGKLIGLVDYADSSNDHTVVVEIIMDNNDGNSLFCTYNNKKGINSGTKEFANKVTVVQGKEKGESNALAELTVSASSSSSYTIENFDGSKEKLTVMVKGAGKDGTVDYAIVSIELSGTPTTSPPTTVAPTSPSVIKGTANIPSNLGTDIAKTAAATLTASSIFNDNFQVTNAVDDIISSQWSSKKEGNKAWAKIDFQGSLKSCAGFGYKSRVGVDQVYKFTLTFSDGSDVTCHVDTSKGTYLQYYDLSNVNGAKETSFIEFHVLSSAGSTCNSGAYEFHVYEGAPSAASGLALPDAADGATQEGDNDEEEEEEGTIIATDEEEEEVPTVLGSIIKPSEISDLQNLALESSVSASSAFSGSHLPEYAIDGNNETQWASWFEGTKTWLEVSFFGGNNNKSVQPLYFGYLSRQGLDFVTKFELSFGSSNGSKQICIMDDSSANVQSQMQYFNIESSNVITNSITFSVLDGGNSPGAIEIEIYGKEVDDSTQG